MPGVVLVGLPSEVESQLRYALSGQVLVTVGTLDQVVPKPLSTQNSEPTGPDHASA